MSDDTGGRVGGRGSSSSSEALHSKLVLNMFNSSKLAVPDWSCSICSMSVSSCGCVGPPGPDGPGGGPADELLEPGPESDAWLEFCHCHIAATHASNPMLNKNLDKQMVKIIKAPI